MSQNPIFRLLFQNGEPSRYSSDNEKLNFSVCKKLRCFIFPTTSGVGTVLRLEVLSVARPRAIFLTLSLKDIDKKCVRNQKNDASWSFGINLLSSFSPLSANNIYWVDSEKPVSSLLQLSAAIGCI